MNIAQEPKYLCALRTLTNSKTTSLNEALAYINELQRKAARWEALAALWSTTTELSLTQDDDGRWSISQGEPVEHIMFKKLTGETPDEAIDLAVFTKEGEPV